MSCEKDTSQSTLDHLLSRLNNDEIADMVASKCEDPNHNETDCVTCNARGDGIEEYRLFLKLAHNNFITKQGS